MFYREYLELNIEKKELGIEGMGIVCFLCEWSVYCSIFKWCVKRYLLCIIFDYD